MIWWMWILFSIFFFTLAFSWAKLEIAVEGKHGYAEKLPCKRWQLKGALKKIAGGRPELTEYHVWMVIFLFLVFHLSHWFSNWNHWRLELLILGLFLIFFVLEDFFWFVLNPDYGLKKFNKEEIPWHVEWAGPIPRFYLWFVLIGTGLIIPSQII